MAAYAFSAAAVNAGLNASIAARCAKFDVGGAGKIKIYSAAAVLLCTVALAATSFDVPSLANPSVALGLGLPLSGIAGAAGTATNYTITDHNDLVVGTSTVIAELGLDTPIIEIGDTVTVTTLSASLAG
jgi:hypothetical protein